MTPDDLLAAVRARLDSGERIAQKELAARYMTAQDGRTVWPLPTRFRDRDPGIAAGLTLVEMCNPAVVLRLVAAHREIVAAYELARQIPPSEVSSFICGQDDGYRQAYEDVIRALADGLGIDLEETPDA